MPSNSSSSSFSSSTALQTVAFHTLGCKTNQLESSTLAKAFQSQGWQVVDFDEAASLYVINTCTVTEKGDQESRRIIRRAHLSNPEGRIAVTGCYAQVSPQEVAGLDGVNYVIGNQFKDRLVDIIEHFPTPEKEPLVRVSEIDKSRLMEGASSAALDQTRARTRGSLKIQDGCDYKCTYCIIWEARGPSRSLPPGDIEAQLQQMLEAGFKDITLTGINIGQYDAEGCDLAGLLRRLIALEGTFRLRLTSLDPLEVSDALIDVVAQSGGKIAPHFHLSTQSAEDEVLRRMARRHHVADFVRICEQIEKTLPQACIAADVIVGFPGETDAHFEATYAVLASVPLHALHVFSYSPRKGTPAAVLPEQVPADIKKDRARRLIQLAEEKNLAFRKRFVGQLLEMIVEDSGEKGTSENYIKLTLVSHASDTHALMAPFVPNTLLQVQVIEVTAEQTLAIPVQVLAEAPAEVSLN